MDAKLIGNGETKKDFQILIDSRTITNPDNSIFFAIKTPFNDGHKYITELIDKGLKIFVVNQEFKTFTNTDCVYMQVKDTVQALQDLAYFHRKHFDIPVIGITGSNGKTIVKEWLLQLLSNNYKICANPKSFNSQVGVPISLWQLKPEHQMGIFEAGISGMGQMDHHEHMIQANIGVLTHLGTAHNEGFDNAEQKLTEKLKLFKHCNKVYSIYHEAVFKHLNKKLICFGYQVSEANLNITEIKRNGLHTHITGIYQNNTIQFKIPFTDEASIENACLCCLIVLEMGFFDATSFELLQPISMRMELKKGKHNCLLLNDSYSNDLNALSTALSFLNQQSIHSKTTVILSDIEESGLPLELLFSQIKSLLLEKKVNRLIGIGPNYMANKKLFENEFEATFYPNTKAFLDDFYMLQFKEESILIKGARIFEFEKIVKYLEQESHGTMLEINLSAALKNLNTIKQKLPQQMKVMAMVKAFAYGSGSFEVAKLLQNKVDYLAVAYIDEGIALRQTGITTPIMVLNTGEENFEKMILHQLEPVVFSINQLQSLLQSIKEQTLKIHIELDTGMHRLGFTENDLNLLINLLQENPQIRVASIFSHLSGSDEKQFDDFTKHQIAQFKIMAKRIESTIGYNTIKHISNTAAILRFGQEGLDMVRLGIGLYGIDPTGQFIQLLEPVFTLKTYISQIKNIEANESIGYARKAISAEARKIGILALGYADGLNRTLSNGLGGFYIRGKYAPIIGNICMDMCMVELKGIDCEEGDEAILFGKDHPISDLSVKLNTIPYEILTSISQRVKRVYLSE